MRNVIACGGIAVAVGVSIWRRVRRALTIFVIWAITVLYQCPFAELLVSALDGNQLVVDFVKEESASHKTSSESVCIRVYSRLIGLHMVMQGRSNDRMSTDGW